MYVAGVLFLGLCYWAAPAFFVAGPLCILAGYGLALSARAERRLRTAALSGVIATAAVLQSAMLALGIDSMLPFQLLWGLIALTAVALAAGYLVDRLRGR